MRRTFAIIFATCLVITKPTLADDLDEIIARGELRHLGIPYANFVTGDGDGFDVEMVKEFSKYLGVSYKLVLSNFYTILGDLLGRQVARAGGNVTLAGDVPIRGDMIAAGFTILPWRTQVVLFSAPTFPSQVLLVARADAAAAPITASGHLDQDIAATRRLIGSASLLVMEGTCLDPANYGLAGQSIDLHRYIRSTNLNEMVPALLNREADLTLLDVPDALLDIQKWAGQIKILGPISEPQMLGAAFRPTGPKLRDAFNTFLAGLRTDGRYDDLVRRYFVGVRSYFPDFFRPE